MVTILASGQTRRHRKKIAPGAENQKLSEQSERAGYQDLTTDLRPGEENS